MKILESAENYLETILILQKKIGNVRSIDIVHALNFSKPSVSIAMKGLKKEGLIAIDSDGYIGLTESGNAIALEIYEKHTILTKALTSLGVSEETAKEDACKIEHHISNETFLKIKAYVEKD